MTACVSEELLLEFLDERLHGRDLDEVVSHIQICPGCKKHLEKLTPCGGAKTTERGILGERDLGEWAAAPLSAYVEVNSTSDAIAVANFDESIVESGDTPGSTNVSMVDLFPADPYRTVSHSGVNSGVPLSELGSRRSLGRRSPGIRSHGGSARAAWVSCTRRASWGSSVGSP